MKPESIIEQIQMLNPQGLKQVFEGIAEEYRKRLCDGWGIDISDSWWVLDKPGEMLTLTDEYAVNFDEMCFFVDNAISYEAFKEHWNYNYAEFQKPEEERRMVNVYTWFERNYRDVAMKGGEK